MTFSSYKSIDGRGWNISAFMSNAEAALNYSQRDVLLEVITGVVKEAVQVYLKDNLDDMLSRLDPNVIADLTMKQLAAEVGKAIRGEK